MIGQPMRSFIFGKFMSWINQGLTFRDVNMYTTFSKNSNDVIKFYCNYFQNESVDIAGDLKQFFEGFSRFVTHP